jgi:hypothetical protein
MVSQLIRFFTTAVPQASQKATVEEVEDEDDAHTSSPKKKKKKSKKKKKKMDSSADMPQLSTTSTVQSVGSDSSTTPTSTPASKNSQSSAATYTPSFMSSMASLTLAETTAQSAHAYLQEQQLNKSEKKIKSRPDHASLFSHTEERRGLLSKLSSVVKGRDKEKEMQEARQSWFSKLGKKTTGLMHQLLKPGDKDTLGDMKWEHFLKVSSFHDFLIPLKSSSL